MGGGNLGVEGCFSWIVYFIKNVPQMFRSKYYFGFLLLSLSEFSFYDSSFFKKSCYCHSVLTSSLIKIELKKFYDF